MNNPAKPKLTIFTPAWNRADLLPRLFRSIADQLPADGSVEWLVIDDGSTDNTPEVLAQFAAERPDLVRFLRVANGGKHRAINRAAHEAGADWIMFVDSDDAVAKGAIADVLRETQACRDPVVGLLRGLSSFPDQGRKESLFCVPRNPCFHWEWKSTQEPFDSAQVFRRSALKLHMFPEFPGERFMAEAWLYHGLDRTHQVHFVNRVWTNCWYQPGGLSDSALSLRLASPRGTECVYGSIVKSNAGFKIRARSSINLWRYRFHSGTWLAKITRREPLFYLVFGGFMYLTDLMRVWRARVRSN